MPRGRSLPPVVIAARPPTLRIPSCAADKSFGPLIWARHRHSRTVRDDAKFPQCKGTSLHRAGWQGVPSAVSFPRSPARPVAGRTVEPRGMFLDASSRCAVAARSHAWAQCAGLKWSRRRVRCLGTPLPGHFAAWALRCMTEPSFLALPEQTKLVRICTSRRRQTDRSIHQSYHSRAPLRRASQRCSGCCPH